MLAEALSLWLDFLSLVVVVALVVVVVVVLDFLLLADASPLPELGSLPLVRLLLLLDDAFAFLLFTFLLLLEVTCRVCQTKQEIFLQ